MRKIVFGAGTVLVIAVASAGTAQGQRKPIDAQCTFNDECADGLVCEARFCRETCRSDRDCVSGERCALPSGKTYRACLPPATGSVFGRIDDTPGVGCAGCTVEAVGTTVRASTDASGEFVLAGLAAGSRDLVVRSAPVSSKDRSAEASRERRVRVIVEGGRASTTGTVILPPGAGGTMIKR